MPVHACHVPGMCPGRALGSRIPPQTRLSGTTAHGIYSRAYHIAPEPVRAVVVEPERPAIAPAPQITVNIFGTPSAEQTAITRQAHAGQGDGPR
jgi:hypothetical protein